MNKLIYNFIILMFIVLLFGSVALAGIMKGTITDYDSSEPIPHVTVRVEGTGQSMLANDNGEYRIRLDPGTYKLKFSHIAHYSEYAEINIGDSVAFLDIKLHPSMIVLKPLKVYDRKYDPGQRIIIEAIKRKEDILSQIHDYSFEAYARMVIEDTTKPDTTDIMYIFESQLKCFWEQPDKYKEIITARRQTANVKGGNVIMAVGGILNLNLNRVNMEEYSIVSPTAEDALDHYNYYLLDTIYIDSQAVFRLEIEPKNNADPLFTGFISIADSTYNVVGVDVGFNEAVEFPFMDSLRFGQSFAEFEGEYWMPIEQRISGVVDLPIPGIPVMDINYLASLHNYEIELGHPDGTFNEYVLEIDEMADDIDSVTWRNSQTVPLTEKEIDAYSRIDSVANMPVPIGKKLLQLGGKLLGTALFSYDYFHFNRVEGAYLGARFRKNDILPGLDIYLKNGYAIDGEFWQHNYSIGYLVSERLKLRVRAGYHDEIVRRPTILSDRNHNPTLLAITDKTDPLEYYLEKGFHLGFGLRPIRKTGLSITYHDYNQYSVSNSTEFSMLRDRKKHSINPSIIEGKLRSISAELRWDSRDLMRGKKEEFRLTRLPYVRIRLGVEYAGPDLIDNDFHFTRYHASIYRRQQSLGLGVTTLYMYGGWSENNLPPQKYFTIDYGANIFTPEVGFKTLAEDNFAGNRVGMAYISHDFGRILFRKSGIPLIKDIPFSFILGGGAFWTDYRDQPDLTDNSIINTAVKPYYEIGFGIGRIPPIMMALYFTWQLSDYGTSKFSLGFGFSF